MQDSQNQRHKLYVGMTDGVCVLTGSDGDRGWEHGEVTPLAHAAARLSVSGADPDRAYLAAYEAGVYRTDDGGLSWRHLSSYPSDYAHSVLAYPENPHTVYVGSEPSAVFRSDDGGETWEECAGFRAVPESSEWFFHAETRYSHVRDLRMAPHDPRCLYAGIEVGGVVRSQDGGESWQQLRGTNADVHHISLSAVRPETVYVATAAGPYRSDDGGRGWLPIDHGLQRHYSVQITPAPDDADLVLVSVASSAQRKNAQLYRSTSGGRDWQRVESMGSDDNMVVAMDWDRGDPRRVYAGTDRGKIFCSNDRGKSWEQLPITLPSVAVGALEVG